MVSIYCERIDAGFWAEPLNAVSNGAFLVAALLGLVWLRRAEGRDVAAGVLVALAAAIGVGSFLFHTVPARWSLLADVVPIQLFAFGYFALALHRFLGLRAVAVGAGAAAFLLVCLALPALLAPLIPFPTRGSLGYLGFLLALPATALAARRRFPWAARLLAWAGFVFAVSLAARTLDAPACAAVPIGLHWLWHLLNATVLALLLRAAIRPASATLRDRTSA